MKTLNLALLLALTIVSGVGVAAQPAAADVVKPTTTIIARMKAAQIGGKPMSAGLPRHPAYCGTTVGSGPKQAAPINNKTSRITRLGPPGGYTPSPRQ